MTERKKTGADKLEQNTKVEVAQTDVVEANTQPITCGLIMPIASNDGGTAEHWAQVRTMISDALAETNLKVQMVSESDEVNVIHKNIVLNIYSNEIVICDVSSRNPNVMFELGMRLTFDKPVVIIKDKDTPFSFDVGSIQHLEYPKSLNYVEILVFQRELRDKVLSTLEASKTGDYSPFLSNYKIKKVTGIDTEFVNKSDYVLGAIKELKDEVRTVSLNLAAQKVSMTSTNPTIERLRQSKDTLNVSPSIVAELSKEIMKSGYPLDNQDDLLNHCIQEINWRYPGITKSVGLEIAKKVVDYVMPF